MVRTNYSGVNAMPTAVHIVIRQHEEEIDPRDYIDDTKQLLAEMNGPTLGQSQTCADKPTEKVEDK